MAARVGHPRRFQIKDLCPVAGGDDRFQKARDFAGDLVLDRADRFLTSWEASANAGGRCRQMVRLTSSNGRDACWNSR